MTYQPRWDTFGRFIQPLASRVPLMTTSGNRATYDTSTDMLLHAAAFGAFHAPSLSQLMPSLSGQLMLCYGADEIETQTDGTEFAAYKARYPTPHKRSGSSDSLWYRCAGPTAGRARQVRKPPHQSLADTLLCQRQSMR